MCSSSTCIAQMVGGKFQGMAMDGRIITPKVALRSMVVEIEKLSSTVLRSSELISIAPFGSGDQAETGFWSVFTQRLLGDGIEYRQPVGVLRRWYGSAEIGKKGTGRGGERARHAYRKLGE